MLFRSSGSVQALTGLCIGLGPPGTLRLILARLFGRGSVRALTDNILDDMNVGRHSLEDRSHR